MDINKLVDSLFCNQCVSIDILKGNIQCEYSYCECKANSNFASLLDMFANLCYLVDGSNFKDFNSELNFIDPREIRRHTMEINQTWNNHISEKPYSSNEYKYISSQSLYIIKEDLKTQKNNNSLLLRVVFWIRTLDNYFSILLDYIDNEIINESHFPTKRGVLLLRLKSKVADYVFNIRKEVPHTDPNRLKLRYFLNNLHLSKKVSADNYIKHRYLDFGTSKSFKNNDIEDLKIGFLSGDFTVDDYDWCIEESSNTSKLFYFNGINNKNEYCEIITKKVKELLESNPHFIILPELFTPVDLQEKIQQEIDDYYFRKTMKDEPVNLLMVFPGSFHSWDHNNTYIFNVSRVINSSGELVEMIYKQNQFIIKKDENHTGILESFKKHDGYEKISFTNKDITIFDTSLGRIAILICIDFIIDEIAEVLEDRLVDIIFVMAMTPKPDSGKFKRRFQELSEKNKAVVIIGNNGSKAVKNVINLPGINKPYTTNSFSEVKSISEIF